MGVSSKSRMGRDRGEVVKKYFNIAKERIENE